MAEPEIRILPVEEAIIWPDLRVPNEATDFEGYRTIQPLVSTLNILRTENHELIERLNLLISAMGAKQRELDIVKNSLAELKEILANRPSGSSHQARAVVPEPDDFDGDRRKFPIFKSQLVSYFSGNAAAYSDAKDRFRYTCNKIKGSAYQHVMHMVNDLLLDKPPRETYDFPYFLDYLDKAFGPIDAKGDAQAKFDALKQTGSVDGYATQYRTYMHQTGYDKEYINTSFIRNLKPYLRNHLVGKERPDNFDELVNMVAKLETDAARLSDKSILTPKTMQTSKGSNYAPKAPAKDPNAMDVDRLTPDELAERKRKGQCFTRNCASTAHMTKDCPLRKGKTRVAAAKTEEASIEEVTDERALVPISSKSLDQRNSDSLAELTAMMKDFISLAKKKDF